MSETRILVAKTFSQGTMLDPVKCSKLSMEEKRELVYELSKHPHGTPEMLQSWSRHEILQLLCAEMGKERKYTGLTKLKIIENLLKIVSEKNSWESGARVTEQQMPADSVDNRTVKSVSNGITDLAPVINCKNSACKASLSQQDVFCKRCSCCICQKFDDNKDPSLWLTCCSEPPFEGESCNMSCHLECAMRHDRSGLSMMGQVAQLDGSFYCVSCGKMNDLLKCWKKQLMIARDTRRVDILCYRVYLSQKLLSGTNKYQNLSDIVDEAVNKLQSEVGPLTDITVKMGRGIVNRMSAGQHVQRLCASAVELLDSMLSEIPTQMLTHHVDQANTLRFEDIITHEARVSTTALAEEVVVKTTTPEGSHSPATNCSTLSNPSSVEDEMNNITSGKHALNDVVSDQSGVVKLENKHPQEGLVNDENELNTSIKTRLEIVPCPPPVTGLQTPCKIDILGNVRRNKRSKSSKREADEKFRNGEDQPQPSSSSKKRMRNSKADDGCEGAAELEFYVKVMRNLECEGHIEKSFRQKFLTWYSLRATPREMHVVQVFVNALRDDPASLAEQLVDAFEEIVSGKRFEALIPSGFCMKLWH